MNFWGFPQLSKFPKIWNPIRRFATCEATRIHQFITNNHTSFHLRWKEDLFNHQKISKYYEHDCRSVQIYGTGNIISPHFVLMSILSFKLSTLPASIHNLSMLYNKKLLRNSLHKPFNFKYWYSYDRKRETQFLRQMEKSSLLVGK